MILSTNFVPRGFDAITVWPFILVRPERQDDVGLVEHERVHFRDMAWITPLWWLLYLFDRNWRVAAEVQAYRVSMEHGMPLDIAARWLMKYDSRLSVDGAIAKLTRG